MEGINYIMKIRIKQVLLIFLIYFIKFISIFIKPRENYWIISERGKEARDNGYCFYNYMKREHSEQKCYYLITKDSPDINRIDRKDVLKYNTFKHYYYCVNACCIISTHTYLFFPHCFYRLYKLLDLKPKIIFLQHGIIKDLIPFYFKKNNNVDLFITSAIPEYNYVLNEFGFSDDVVKCTGLARYDNLKNIKTKDMILLMPTWRQNYVSFTENEFLMTDFYNEWNNLLKKISDYDNKNYEIIFYLHYEFQKFSHLFKGYSNNIKIAKLNNYDVQTLLKETKLLITDFSSVYFDIAYMDKPVIYFQFDEIDFFKNNYNKGYFDYYKNGFGKVTHNSQETLEQLQFYIRNNFNREEIFTERKCRFFKYSDCLNSQRIYKEIIKKLNNN